MDLLYQPKLRLKRHTSPNMMQLTDLHTLFLMHSIKYFTPTTEQETLLLSSVTPNMPNKSLLIHTCTKKYKEITQLTTWNFWERQLVASWENTLGHHQMLNSQTQLNLYRESKSTNKFFWIWNSKPIKYRIKWLLLHKCADQYNFVQLLK